MIFDSWFITSKVNFNVKRLDYNLLSFFSWLPHTLSPTSLSGSALETRRKQCFINIEVLELKKKKRDRYTPRGLPYIYILLAIYTFFKKLFTKRLFGMEKENGWANVAYAISFKYREDSLTFLTML
ncbi:hypothetical protein WA026_021485 [Henosepilachna vigintioctopunctata]|uniref:Uncharacterized protein n=1 Tax=Henosepilachna vigintioctopunctata TaxID=420089 RepID=A0AAW1UR55_9CUCU